VTQPTPEPGEPVPRVHSADFPVGPPLPMSSPPPSGPAYPGPPPPGYRPVPETLDIPTGPPKSRLTAGLLGIFLGGFGAQRFYLGYPSMGVLQILVTIATCGIGALWGTVEGILILSGYRRLSTDAYGRPLAR
jgi:hypothetical protein